jgi:hypothetical protein
MKSRIDALLRVSSPLRVFPVKQPSVRAEIAERAIVDNDRDELIKQVEYEMRLCVFTRFYTNNENYHQSRQNALKQLKYELYRDVVSDLYEAINASGGNRECIEILNRAVDKMIGQ